MKNGAARVSRSEPTMPMLFGKRSSREVAQAAQISKTQAGLARRGLLPDHPLLRASLATALGTTVEVMVAAAARTVRS